jgi:site-specific DNA-methyltransferase (adenine-specific)
MKYLGGKIYQGDCLEVMKKLPDQSVDMVLCDLPYGTTQNKWDSVIPLDKLWAEYRRIIKPKGVIALSSQGIFTARLILSNEAWFRYKFVWVKSKPTNFLNARKQPLRQHEDICIFYGSQPHYRPVMSKGEPYDKGTRKAQYTGSYGDFKPVQVKSEGERFPTDTLYCKTAESEAGGRVWHPTQKPVALGRYLIRMFTGEGDVVLDNAFGSGSFLVAAALEGRKFIGIEKNEEVHLFKEEKIDYIKVAKQRLAEVADAMKSKEPPPPIFSALQPAARAGQPNRRGMVDVDEVIRQASKKAV